MPMGNLVPGRGMRWLLLAIKTACTFGVGESSFDWQRYTESGRSCAYGGRGIGGNSTVVLDAAWLRGRIGTTIPGLPRSRHEPAPRMPSPRLEVTVRDDYDRSPKTYTFDEMERAIRAAALGGWFNAWDAAGQMMQDRRGDAAAEVEKAHISISFSRHLGLLPEQPQEE